jgi:hypothetical protein
LIGSIEVRFISKSDLRDQVSWSFAFYLALAIVGSTATTLLAEAVTKGKSLPGAAWFWYAFIGVFGFEAIIKRLNLTLFDAPALTISEWMEKARDGAVAQAIESSTNKAHARRQELAGRLRKLPDKDLRTYAVTHLGQEPVKTLEAATAASGTDLSLHFALALAGERANDAEAIVKSRNL